RAVDAPAPRAAHHLAGAGGAWPRHGGHPRGAGPGARGGGRHPALGPDRRLRGGPHPRDPRPASVPRRRVATGDPHARRGRTRLGRAPGARLRHPRRREAPGHPHPAAPPGAGPERANRGDHRRRGAPAGAGTGAGAAMMRPTRRALVVAGAGVPLALLPALLSPRLWPVWTVALLLFLLMLGLDAVL